MAIASHVLPFWRPVASKVGVTRMSMTASAPSAFALASGVELYASVLPPAIRPTTRKVQVGSPRRTTGLRGADAALPERALRGEQDANTLRAVTSPTSARRFCIEAPS